MLVPKDLKYSSDHEWVKVEDGQVTIGISDYAQDQLGGLVYVSLPKTGDTFEAGDVFGEVESVKSVSELIAPLSGEVVAVNTELEDAPELINEDPYQEGWIMKISPSEPDQISGLLDAAAYEKSL